MKSKEEAIEWAKRCPFPVDLAFGGEGEIEIRQLFESADFGPAAEAHDRLTREAAGPGSRAFSP